MHSNVTSNINFHKIIPNRSVYKKTLFRVPRNSQTKTIVIKTKMPSTTNHLSREQLSEAVSKWQSGGSENCRRPFAQSLRERATLQFVVVACVMLYLPVFTLHSSCRLFLVPWWLWVLWFFAFYGGGDSFAMREWHFSDSRAKPLSNRRDDE